ncbi:P-loop NTPase fold protein [Klebsiella quasipneumoniae]|uniref:P-loop NTPase fold protein n=1 Tax=Klebsiella quasipneumoniae TaxID=1463165 RepID=UPI0023E2E809|nr:P-loop NTPase fold protein [Klebsiella quasipneumoniae]
MAENISRSILTLPQEASNVVGIEGAWGSGKTSLLNLILRNLALNKDAHTHVLHISPWLSGGSPVEALFLPVATVIQQEMEKRYPPKGFKKLWRKYLLSPEAQKVSKRTARTVLTGMCYSVGSVMRQGSSSLTRLTGQSAMTSRTWRR